MHTPNFTTWALIVFFTGTLLSTTKSAKILSLIPFPMKSHDLLFKPLLLELAKRGHQVTSITAYPMQKNITNYEEIVFETNTTNLFKNIDFYEFRSSTTLWNIGWFDMFPFWGICLEGLENIFNTPEVINLINSSSPEGKFDLVICEGFFGYEALFAFGELYKAPTIAVSSLGSMIYINQYIGNPLELSHFPYFLLPYTNKMSFLERLHNVAMNLYIMGLTELYHVPDHEKLVKKYFGQAFGSRQIPSIREMVAEVSLVLANSHSILGYARSNIPNIIDVGGLHIQQLANETIDKELERQMDEAKSGVIYFSLGSNVNIKHLPDEYRQAFQDALSKFPQMVLWKSDDESQELTKNVIVKKWFPQQQILAHKNCRGFITHGGILSLEEAVYYAVPVIGIPFFADQPMNMQLVDDKKIGIKLEYNNLTVDSITWALDQILNNKMYKDNARKVSSIFTDNVRTPLETAVFWTEYAIKHDGAKHLRTAARQLPWYKLLLLDIILAVFGAVFILSLIIYITLRSITQYFRRKIKFTSVEKKVN